MRRDPDRLYARGVAGELAYVTGVHDPYEAPVSPELRLVGAGRGPDDLLAGVLSAMRAHGVGRNHAR